jgi:hypothetical protein
MCFKTIMVAMRKAGILACLKKVWIARLEATGIMVALEIQEAAGEPIVRLGQIWGNKRASRTTKTWNTAWRTQTCAVNSGAPPVQR